MGLELNHKIVSIEHQVYQNRFKLRRYCSPRPIQLLYITIVLHHLVSQLDVMGLRARVIPESKLMPRRAEGGF